MTHGRRSFLSGLAVALPFGLASRTKAATPSTDVAPGLRLRSFEESVRVAFAVRDGSDEGPGPSCRRVEVGHSDLIREGVQGCRNDRPFAGFPAGHLRIVRTGCEPGPARQGVRLYVSTVDVAFVGDRSPEASGRPLDFASLPHAVSFA